MKRLLLILIASLALVVPSQAEAIEIGGIDRWGGTGWCKGADVWKTGHAPTGGYVMYRYHFRVSWCTDFVPHINNLSYRAHFSNEQWPANTQGTVFSRSYRYTCSINGVRRVNGCAYFERKGKATLSPTGIVCYPWVKIRIAAEFNGSGVRYWAWGSNFPTC